MAKSNAVLITSILALALALGDDTPVTGGLNNVALTSLESELKTRKAKAEADAVAKAEADADAAAKAEAELEEYVIAPGRSVTSLKGIRGEGDEALAKHFPGGEKTFQDLIERGIVVKK